MLRRAVSAAHRRSSRDPRVPRSARTFRVWCPVFEETEATARRVRAPNAREAARRWARWSNESAGSPHRDFVGNEGPVEVRVCRPGRSARRFTVACRYPPPEYAVGTLPHGGAVSGAAPIALLVGEVNPYQAAEDAAYALYPYPDRSAGGRMCRVVLGLEPRVYLGAYARRNLCSGRWSAPAARQRAAELLREHATLPVVLLGAKVADAFGQPFEPFTRAGRFVRLPHPSGLSRLWNDSGSFERARAVMREAGALVGPQGEVSTR